MQLLLSVGRRSIVSVTLENMASASEVAYLSVIQAKLLLLSVSGGHFVLHLHVAGNTCRSMFHCVDDP
jgi:hypothetical protein